MSEMKSFVCFSLLVLLILLSQSLPSSARQGALDTNPHHGTQLPPKTKDFLSSFESQKLRIYVRKRVGGGTRGAGVAAGTRGRTSSSANGKRPTFLQAFLSLTLFLGVVLL